MSIDMYAEHVEEGELVSNDDPIRKEDPGSRVYDRIKGWVASHKEIHKIHGTAGEIKRELRRMEDNSCVFYVLCSCGAREELALREPKPGGSEWSVIRADSVN